MLDTHHLDHARQFIWRAARIIERRRFEFLFEGGSTESVLDALRAYRNEDGGFGHALEPDIRGPESQPVQTFAALVVLDEIGQFTDPMLESALEYLSSVSSADGGVPALLPTQHDVPHAPWMTPAEGPSTGNLLPTAGLAGLLLKNAVSHPWLPAASVFCWDAIGAIKTTHPYEVEFALMFLSHAPDRERAEREAERLGELVRHQGLVVIDRDTATLDTTPPGYAPGEFHYPLNYAAKPSSLARRWFCDDEIEQNLDALEREQSDDGGWMFNWGQWNEATTIESRGAYTIHVLQTLQAYGRIG